jgi:Transcriptional regulator
MPKKFTEQEREWINGKLLAAGRQCFESYGLAKTSIADLTKAAGISQGAFYLFYGSKEELFFEVLQEDERHIRDKMLEAFPPGKAVGREDIRRFLLESLRMLDENPLLRRAIGGRELEGVMRKLPQEKLERNFAEDRDALLPVITAWQSAGLLSGCRPELIVSMIRSLVLLSLHREEIGEELYPGTMELLAEVMAAGIASLPSGAEGGVKRD